MYVNYSANNYKLTDTVVHLNSIIVQINRSNQAYADE